MCYTKFKKEVGKNEKEVCKMKKTPKIFLFILAGMIVVSCTACSTATDNESESSQGSNANQSTSNIEGIVSNTDVKADSDNITQTYTTHFGEANAVTYPSFTFDYPNNWTISYEEVTQTNETVILTNERGVTVQFSYIGGVAEGNLGGGSATDMLRVEVSKAADSSFLPGYVHATDHTDLGTFMVAKLKVTGHLDMKSDTDFENVDGAISYAVLPESSIGTADNVRGPFESEFSFWYSGCVSLIASSPDGQFTETEEQQVIKILSSFRVEP